MTVSAQYRCPDLICRIGIGADLGIFPLIGIVNFESGPKPDFFFFFMSEHNLWQNAVVRIALLWQTCG